MPLSKHIDHMVTGRLFEWLMTLSMLGLAIEIFLWPKTIEFSAFAELIDVITNRFVGMFMFVVGWSRAVALVLNGHSIGGIRLGPLMRSVLAVLCAVMWGQFALALLQLSISQSRPSPGLPFWAMFVLGELYVAYRAVRDGKGREAVANGRNH